MPAPAPSQDVIQFCREERERGHFATRQHYEPGWQENVEAFMAFLRTPMPPGAEWVDDRMAPDLFRNVESLLAQEQAPKLNNPRPFSVDSPGSPGEPYQWLVHALLTTKTRNAAYYTRQTNAKRMLIITGHAVQKSTWLREIGLRRTRNLVVGQNAFGEPMPQFVAGLQEDLVFDGPWPDWPDIMDVWKSPETDRFGYPFWWQERRDHNIDAIEYEDAQYEQVGGLYSPAGLKALRTTLSVRPTKGTSGVSRLIRQIEGGDAPNQDNLQALVTGISPTQRRGEGGVVWWEWWGYIPPEIENYRRRGESQWRLIEWVGDGIGMRDIEAPIVELTPRGLPYRDVFAIRVGNSPYGYSLLHWANTEAEQRSLLRNLRLAEVFMQMFAPVVAKKSAFDEEEMHRFPGATWWADEDVDDVRGVFATIPRQSQLQDAYIEDQMRERQVDTTMASTPPFRGEFAAGGSHRTRGEFEGTVALGSGRQQVMQSMSDAQMDEQWLIQSFRLCQLFLDQAELVQLQEDHNARGPVSFLDLQWPIHIAMDTDYGRLGGERLQSAVQLFGMLLSNPETAITQRWPAITRDLWHYAGYPRAARYTKTDEEIANEIAQRQEAALLQAALESGAGQAAGGPGPGGGR